MVSRVQRYISPIASRLAGLKYVDRRRLETYFQQAGSSRELDLAKSAGIVKSSHQFVTPAEIAHYHFALRLTEDKLAESGIDLSRTPNTTPPSGWINISTTIRNPSEPTPPPPRSEVLPNYPKRGPLTRAYPHLANVGFWLYLGLRLCSIAMVSFISLPIAIALFSAEFHSIFNGIFFQGDIKNEGRYETWKRQNWPSDAEIRQAMGPDGPLTVMHISSAPEPPDTVWPTLYGVLEMEGNKQVVWNTESTKLEIHPKVKKQIRMDVEREGLSGNAAKAEIKKREIAHIYALKKDLFDVVNEEYATVWQYIRSCVPRDWKSLDVNSKRDALQYIWRMLGKRFITRGAIWTWWGSGSEHIPGDAAFAELLSRVYHGALRNLGEVPEGGLWKEVDIESFGFLDETGQFHSFANNLDVLTAKAKRYLSETYASPTEQQLYGFEYMKKLLSDYKQDQLDSFVEFLHKKFKMAQEKSLLTPAFFIKTLKEKGACNNSNGQQLEGAAIRTVEQLNQEQDPDRQLSIIYHFIDSQKNNLSPVWYEYFPRNIRSAGEEIRTGLEYEARAEEVGRLSEAALDEEWERIFNTYSNAQVIWWDRMQLIDSDPQGRKANSLNSCVHHLQGNWVRVIEEGADPDLAKTDGYLIAQDLPSAIMRLCIEKFENGQQIWEKLRPRLVALEEQGVRDIDQLTEAIMRELRL